MSEPRAHTTLRERLKTRQSEHEAYDAIANRLGNVRLFLGLVGVVLLLLPLAVRSSWPWWALILLAGGFLFLGVYQTRIESRRVAARRACRFLEDEVLRLDNRWSELLDDGSDVQPKDVRADLATDLDLFGPSSLFQLLCRAVTPEGRRTLARWLVEPASTEEIRARQVAVRELALRLDVCEGLHVAARPDAPDTTSDEKVLAWAESPGRMPARTFLGIVSIAAPAFLITAGGLWALFDFIWPFVAAVFLQFSALVATKKFVEDRIELLNAPDRALARMIDLIFAIENMKTEAPYLVACLRELKTGHLPAGQSIRRLHTLVSRLEWNENLFFALTLGPALLWKLQVVLRTESWRETYGRQLRAWLVTIGRIEAIASLAGFCAERPDYAFLEIVDEPGVFASTGLCHPLIDRRSVVANDLALSGPGSVLLLSGSNMSGKSTLLRAIGTSVVLGQMGAPVAARSLKMSPFVLSTSIRVTDSLAKGTSHFYAELGRIRTTLELASANGPKVLYLLDEILHGTNSKERFVGAVSIIRALSQARAMGVVTTHDLSLGRVADLISSRLFSSRHFGDDVVEGELHFDYRLKDGPVVSTNALKLMRAVGINVELAPLDMP